MPALEQHLAALQRALHRAAEVGELDRLGQVVQGPALHAQRGAGGVVDGGEHEDRELRLDLDRLRHQVHPARARHADVAQHQRDAVAAQLLQRLLARSGCVDLELLLYQELLEGVPNRLLVVHDQDLGGARRVGHSGLLG